MSIAVSASKVTWIVPVVLSPLSGLTAAMSFSILSSGTPWAASCCVICWRMPASAMTGLTRGCSPVSSSAPVPRRSSISASTAWAFPGSASVPSSALTTTEPLGSPIASPASGKYSCIFSWVSTASSPGMLKFVDGALANAPARPPTATRSISHTARNGHFIR